MTAQRTFSAAARAACAAAGGLTAEDSPAKAKALRALHKARRGVRVHDTGRERATVLAEIATAVRTPERGVASIRVVADFCRVSDRTVRRWLAGEDWPAPEKLRRLRQWLRK